MASVVCACYTRWASGSTPYHMNEGHSALLGLELLRRHAYRPEDLRPGESPYNLPRVRDLCRFTTHTPVDAGHDRFSYELCTTPPVERPAGRVATRGIRDAAAIGRAMGDLNMTRLALNLSEVVNGVARRHAELSAQMFPGYQVRAITNGVHPFTWTARRLSRALRPIRSGLVPRTGAPDCASIAFPDAAIAAAHAQAKQALIEKVHALCGVALDPKVPILGFARRMTAYKRPELLFSDLERLKAIAQHPLVPDRARQARRTRATRTASG